MTLLQSSYDINSLWPILLYFGLVVLIAAIMIGLSWLLGQKHMERTTGKPFESGMPLTGSARLRFTSQFYIIAMFFVIFDLDVAFLIAWAISFREVAWPGYVGAAIFIGILLAILVYEWRTGALNYGPSGKQILKHLKKRRSEA